MTSTERLSKGEIICVTSKDVLQIEAAALFHTVQAIPFFVLLLVYFLIKSKHILECLKLNELLRVITMGYQW